MRKTLFLFSILTLTTNITVAQMGGGGMAAIIIPEVDGETLVYEKPERWYPYNKESEAKKDIYYFPAGQKPNDWEELLHLEIFTFTLDLPDATKVFELKTKNLESTCQTHNVKTEKDGAENRYSVHQWVERCAMADYEMISFRKAILGNESLYLASKIWKYEPKDWETEKWQDYINYLYVCDGTDEHHCRPPNQGRGGGGGMGG